MSIELRCLSARAMPVAFRIEIWPKFAISMEISAVRMLFAAATFLILLTASCYQPGAEALFRALILRMRACMGGEPRSQTLLDHQREACEADSPDSEKRPSPSSSPGLGFHFDHAPADRSCSARTALLEKSDLEKRRQRAPLPGLQRRALSIFWFHAPKSAALRFSSKNCAL